MSILDAQQQMGKTVDLLLICGDFQVHPNMQMCLNLLVLGEKILFIKNCFFFLSFWY